MKTNKIVAFMIFFFLILGLPKFGWCQENVFLKGFPEYVPGEVIVKYKDSLNKEQVQSVIAFSVSGSQIKSVLQPKDPERPVYLIKLPADKSVPDVVSQLKKEPAVEYAEPNYIYQLTAITPNDPRFSDQWYLHNTGQTVNGFAGTIGADVKAREAWDITTGSPNVVIAVIDTGMDMTHPDLEPNLWWNLAEATGTDEVDDDGNGYVDDKYGWDFIDGDNLPTDFSGHGTHVAGIIGAKGNNGQFVTGVNWNVKIMPLRCSGISGFLKGEGETGWVTSFGTAAAIHYAVENHAHIINASYGSSPGASFSQTQYNAWKYASDNNVLCVIAAGNDANNNDTNYVYPADFGYAPACIDSYGNYLPVISNIIAVAATDEKDGLASYSNYGLNSVHIAAPGGNSSYNMLSTYPKIVEGTPQEVISSQNFEGYDGTLPPGWSKGGTNSTWKCGYSLSYLNTFLDDSYLSDYLPNTDSWVGYVTPIPKVKGNKYKLSFLVKHVLEATKSALFIYGSPDGINWNVIPGYFWVNGSYNSETTPFSLAGFNGSSSGNFWPYDFDITYLADLLGQFCFGFNLKTAPDAVGADGVHIDSVQLNRIPLSITDHITKYDAGTSMAAPVVSGIAGLIKARHPDITASQIKNTILSTVDRLSSLSGKVVTGGRVNAYEAIIYNNGSPDKPVNDSPPDGQINSSLTPALTASSFADPEGDTHSTSQWQITITPGNYSSPTWNLVSASGLTNIAVPPDVLEYLTTYSWHVRYQDNLGAWSEWSDETSFTTLSAPSGGGGGGGGVPVGPLAASVSILLSWWKRKKQG